MNANRIFVGEYILAIAFVSYAAIKHKYWPWPGTIVKLSVGFGVLGLIAMAMPEIAAAFGSAVLLAGFIHIYSNGGMKLYNGGQEFAGGQDGSSIGYDVLTIPLDYKVPSH